MICADIQRLILYSIQNGLITKDDELVVRNMLMDALRVCDWDDASAKEAVLTDDNNIDDILLQLIDCACENGVIEDTTANRDLFDTKLMGTVTPMPREIIRDFWERYSSRCSLTRAFSSATLRGRRRSKGLSVH